MEQTQESAHCLAGPAPAGFLTVKVAAVSAGSAAAGSAAAGTAAVLVKKDSAVVPAEAGVAAAFPAGRAVAFAAVFAAVFAVEIPGAGISLKGRLVEGLASLLYVPAVARRSITAGTLRKVVFIEQEGCSMLYSSGHDVETLLVLRAQDKLCGHEK